MENKLKNVFPVFDYVMENKLLIFVFKFIKIMRNKSYKLKVE
jgi:hypothetical protein